MVKGCAECRRSLLGIKAGLSLLGERRWRAAAGGKMLSLSCSCASSASGTEPRASAAAKDEENRLSNQGSTRLAVLLPLRSEQS